MIIYDLDGTYRTKLGYTSRTGDAGFGSSVTLTDTYIIIGAYRWDYWEGAILIYDYAFNKIAHIPSGIYNTDFGYRALTNGTQLLVSEHDAEVNELIGAGKVHLFNLEKAIIEFAI